MTGIYKITNKINGKCYIGQSIDIKRRWRTHKKDAFWEEGPDYNYPLYCSIRKHGIENFDFEVIEECRPELLNEKEIFYIAFYRSTDRHFGYNQNDGGQSNSHSCKLTDKDIDEIIHRLKTTMDNLKSIALDYNVGQTTIYNINIGVVYKRENENYPIRPSLYKLQKGSDVPYELKPEKPTHCKRCGCKVTRGEYCPSCYGIISRKTERPEPMELAKLVKENGFAKTGKLFDVRGQTVQKWLIAYKLPHTRQGIIDWYNEKMGIEDIVEQDQKEKRIKPVKQIDIKTREVLNIFPNQKEALIYLGKVGQKSDHIGQVCRGLRQSAYGYFWEYAD